MIFMERDSNDSDSDEAPAHMVLPVDLLPSSTLEDALVEASRYGYRVLGVASGGASGFLIGASAILQR